MPNFVQHESGQLLQSILFREGGGVGGVNHHVAAHEPVALEHPRDPPVDPAACRLEVGGKADGVDPVPVRPIPLHDGFPFQPDVHFRGRDVVPLLEGGAEELAPRVVVREHIHGEEVVLEQPITERPGVVRPAEGPRLPSEDGALPIMHEPVRRRLRRRDQCSPDNKSRSQPNQTRGHSIPPKGVHASRSAPLTTCIVRKMRAA